MGDFIETSVNYRYLKAGASATSVRGRQAASGGCASASAVSSGGGYPATSSSGAPPPSRGSGEYAKNQKELADLCKRRFYYRQAFDLYGGVAGFFTYGPPGCAMKNNLIRQWRQHFVIEDSLLEIEDTCIMPHQVLKASGHVERFNDFMVKDSGDESKYYRADKLLEDVMEKKLEEAGVTEAQRTEYTSVRNQADAYSKDELHQVFQKYKIKAPETGNDLSEPYPFNLMFPTPIGPGGYLQGYLRPETAQGIFLNYKYCCEQNSNKLPFGVAQVGRSFRNEIAPRAGLTRQREFTQAEIEFFCNPKCKDHPKFKKYADTVLLLFHSDEQLAAKDPKKMNAGEAVKTGFIHNETLGYYMVRTHAFLVSAGVNAEHIRFRQHLPTEMAHYASDCWDAEILTSYGWLECVGIADRACFDLNAHAVASKTDLDYKEKLDKPIEVEVLGITKKSGIDVMKAFKKDGKAVKEWIEAQSQEVLADIEKGLLSKAGQKEVEIDGQSFVLKADVCKMERKKEKIHHISYTPGVVEPSFGIDRIFTAILEHAYYMRPKDDKESDEKQTRGVLSLSPSIAPYKCIILPLDQRISRSDKYTPMLSEFRKEMGSMGLSYTIDDSGATIGRRYARNDELGIPFAVTVDHTSLEDGTVTLRERDDMGQIRLPFTKVAELVRLMCNFETTWASAVATYGACRMP